MALSNCRLLRENTIACCGKTQTAGSGRKPICVLEAAA